MDTTTPQDLITQYAPLFADLKQLGLIAKDASWGSLLGIFAGVAALLTTSISLWRLPRWQSVIAAGASRVPALRWFVWANLPPLVQYALPALLAAIPAVGAAIGGQLTWGGAAIATVAIAAKATLAYLGRQKLGQAISPALGAMPAPARAALAVVVKYDPRRDPNSPQYEPPAVVAP